MSARENILARVSAARGGKTAPGSGEDVLLAPTRGPAPPPESDLVGRFRERAARLASDVAECTTLADVPAAVAAYLAAHQLPRQAICWPALMSLPWPAAGMDVSARAAQGTDLVGITGAFCAIAETGTLMLLSGPDMPASVSLLPETHIAVLDTRRIVATMEDAWGRLRVEQGALPRAVNFISGPSRTADIEQTVTLGAHGPYRVHILLVDNGSGAA
jgi:L-lactate utilization protein LutC